MFENFLQRRKKKKANLELLESLLDATLTPIEPRSDFVHNLRRQLMVSDLQDQIIRPTVTVPRGLLVAGGILGSFLVLLTSIRGMMSLISVISLLVQQARRSSEPKPATSATS